MATNVNANKTFYSRFQLKYDTYENWVSANPVLLAGEMAIATIAAAEGATSLDHNSVPLPQILIKVGDGTSTYTALPFVSAKAADVYEWAKQKYIEHPEELIVGYRHYTATEDKNGLIKVTYIEAGEMEDGTIDWIKDDETQRPLSHDFFSIVKPENYFSSNLEEYFYTTLYSQYPDLDIEDFEEDGDLALWLEQLAKWIHKIETNNVKTSKLQDQVNALELEVGDPAITEGDTEKDPTGLYALIADEQARAMLAEEANAKAIEQAIGQKEIIEEGEVIQAGSGVLYEIQLEQKRAEMAEASLHANLNNALTQIDNLSNIMNFRGAFTATTEVTEPKAGDVIVIKASETTDENGQPVNAAIVGKEYVYDGTEWIELGDTTAEQARLSAIEERVTETETAIGYPTTGEGGEGTGLYREIELEERRALEVEGALDERITVLEEATTDIADLVQEKGYIIFNAGSATEVI